MTIPFRLVIFVAALAVLLTIVMATDGHPLAVIAAVLAAIFLTGRLTRWLHDARPTARNDSKTGLWSTNADMKGGRAADYGP